MPASPRCGALLRDGQPCRRTVAAGSEFCVHHSKLLATVDAETMRQGRTPEQRAKQQPVLRVVPEPALDQVAMAAGTIASADPATVRPSLALAAAENVEQLKASLLEVEAPVPDVRSRVAAIELLLREGLGRAPQSEAPPTPQLPKTVAQVKQMGREEMQYVLATTFVDVIEAVVHDGGEQALRERVGQLGQPERKLLMKALASA
jgi:hypothetical protein